PGEQTVSATDTATPSITGTSNAVTVRAVGATLSFAFAVSADDGQVYVHQVDVGQTTSRAGTLVAPGRFLTVAAGTYGADASPVVFGVGIDHQVYEAILDANGHLVAGWFRVAPGKFDQLVVSNYGSSGSPIVFGIGTPEAGNRQVFAARLDANAHLAQGWFSFAPGQFTSLAAGTFGNGHAEVFGISIDQQAYFARFSAAGAFTDGLR